MLSNAIKSFWNDEEGATAVEYGIMVALIGAAIVATVRTLGGTLDGVFSFVNGELAGIGDGE